MPIKELLTLHGKVALVQGGSRGIGEAIVRRLSAAGASVAFTYVNSAQKAETIVTSLKSEGRNALAIKADAASEAQIKDAVRETVAAFGALDILVNNSGILLLGPLQEFTVEDFDRTLAVNVRSVFIASQAAARHMKHGGRIINIGSVNADRVPFPGGSAYAMSKSALVGLTKGLARDLGPLGITVNNVQPGPVDTDMNPASGEFARSLLEIMAVDRYGTADEVAALVLHVAGPEAGYITGASLMIDGGFSA
nr:3-oxoacyl-ACP reductase family protein [uncultured Pseudomonas sp.]